MKKLFTTVCLAAIALFSMPIFAQDNFSQGHNYYLIYLDTETEGDLTAVSNIKADLRTDDVTKFLYIWEGSYTSPAVSGANWNGSFEGYLNFQVGSVGWSGLGFCFVGQKYDLSGIDESYTFHVAMKSNATNSHVITLIGGSGLESKVVIGADAFEGTAPYTNFTRDGKWHLVEIPMSVFFTGGLRYPEPFDGNYMTLLSGNATGTVISMDAIYIYKKGTNGIESAKADNKKLNVVVTKNVVMIDGTNLPVEVYNLSGQKVKASNEPIFGVDEFAKGVYIAKSGNATAKFVIK
ncbi:MAG: T9SS type A sorting domain-containing protein [Dysgonomonas sp.]